MKDTQPLRDTLLNQIRPNASIGIMSHIEPDGDGFCASLAIQSYLNSMSLASDIIVDEGNLERFGFLMQESQLRKVEPGLRYDLLIILDCNSYDRIGDRAELVKTAGYSLLIDHHVPENGIIKTDYSFVDTSAVSVGAIIFRALQQEIESLPESRRNHVCDCLYTTIINDTNNFTNANTDEEVFRISADLCACGVQPARIYKSFFLNHQPLEMRYVGEVLSTIELHRNGQILFMFSTLEMQERNDLTADSIMNLTRWVQGVKDVSVIAYLREEAPQLYKLSLRSPFLDVNAIAASYGGGGHRSASGANVHGALPQIKEKLLQKLTQALDAYDTNAAG